MCDMTHSCVWHDAFLASFVHTATAMSSVTQQSTPQHTCNTLQHTFNTLHHILASLVHTAPATSTATQRSTLQHTATHYNALLHTLASLVHTATRSCLARKEHTAPHIWCWSAYCSPTIDIIVYTLCHVCSYIYIHIHVNMYIHIYMYVWIHTYVHIYMYCTSTYTSADTNKHVRNCCKGGLFLTQNNFCVPEAKPRYGQICIDISNFM